MGLGTGAIFRARPGATTAEAWIAPGTAGLSNILGVFADDEVKLDRSLKYPDGQRSYGEDGILLVDGNEGGRLMHVSLSGESSVSAKLRSRPVSRAGRLPSRSWAIRLMSSKRSSKR